MRDAQPLIGGRSALLIALLLVPGASSAFAQATRPSTAPAGTPSPAWTTAQDHQDMMGQLGIRKLRPGANSRAGTLNAANYDESKANPFPDLPDPLTLRNGQKVATADAWWSQRRPEIVEDFEREVFG